MGVLRQFIGTVIISTLGIDMGFIFTWPASTMIQFGSANTTLNRPMTEMEISLLNSLSSVGGLISTLTAGFMLDKLGRKYCSIAVSLSLVLIWVMLIVWKQVEVVLFCIFLSGVSSSAALIASVYISEISQESIRGTMTAGNMISYGIGGLMLFSVSGSLSYDTVLYIGLSIAIISTSSLLLIKDSPMYLMTIGKEKEAAESIAFYRQLPVMDKEVMYEVNVLKRAINMDQDGTTPEEEKLKPDTKSKEKLSFWQFMRKSRSSRRAFYVSIVLQIAAVFQGLIVVQTYIQPLIMKTLPAYSPEVCSTAMAAVTVVTSFFAAYLTDKAGRRPLMFYGSIGAAVTCLVLGTQIQFQWGPTWITLVSLYTFPIMYTFGAGTVPNILVAELFLPEVKSILSMVIVEMSWILYSVVLFIFNPILNSLGWGPVFYIFAILCSLSSVFSYFFLPETKGLTVEEIQPLFNKRKHQNNV
ncbi:unnamed protein product [Arctia plantaginis]|uniref:Major facilitator superfamily (MFS) profile domain-containing protein n=1 Tax=Arctia plantaginis TaxID=874455 RepID=A0A8S1A8G4_ARCPL|nr:unnamed protein product [Arctia plantaginis]CAB3246546.1 unnamed protein product [Arctia plantaginis]